MGAEPPDSSQSVSEGTEKPAVITPPNATTKEEEAQQDAKLHAEREATFKDYLVSIALTATLPDVTDCMIASL